MVLVVARHATPATCTPRDKQMRFSKQNKDKRNTKQNYPGFEFKPCQVNDSSQSNQRTDHLVSHLTYRRHSRHHPYQQMGPYQNPCRQWQSSGDSFPFSLQKMGYNRKQLKEPTKHLYDFGGKRIELVGVITLPV
jgi:hypothetical protein